MRVDSWVGEQINRMIESFEISLREQKLAFIANCALEPSRIMATQLRTQSTKSSTLIDLPGSRLYLERSLTKFH